MELLKKTIVLVTWQDRGHFYNCICQQWWLSTLLLLVHGIRQGVMFFSEFHEIPVLKMMMTEMALLFKMLVSSSDTVQCQLGFNAMCDWPMVILGKCDLMLCGHVLGRWNGKQFDYRTLYSLNTGLRQMAWSFLNLNITYSVKTLPRKVVIGEVMACGNSLAVSWNSLSFLWLVTSTRSGSGSLALWVMLCRTPQASVTWQTAAGCISWVPSKHLH